MQKTILMTSLVLSVGSGWIPSAALCADEMQYPLAVAATAEGTVYVADRNLPGIWKISAGKREVYFAAEKKFRTPLNAVRCLAVDGKGQLLAGDSGTREVYRFDESGQPTPLTGGGVGIPMGIAVDGEGEIYVSDLETQRILKIPAAGGEVKKIGEFPAPHGLAVDAQNRLWIVSHGPTQLFRLSPEGKVDKIVAERTFKFPHNVVVDAKGAAYISDGYAKAIWKIDESGKPVKWISGEPLVNPVGLAVQGEKLLVADPRSKQVFEVDAAGTVIPFAAQNDR